MLSTVAWKLTVLESPRGNAVYEIKGVPPESERDGDRPETYESDPDTYVRPEGSKSLRLTL